MQSVLSLLFLSLLSCMAGSAEQGMPLLQILVSLQLWKTLEGHAKDALKQASQQLSDLQQAEDEAARLRWTAETAQR